MSASIVDRIKSADNLPTLPAVAVQVLEAIQNDSVSVGEIAQLIQQDPALTVKILKVVNSSLFGMPRRISSLQQAMVVLGLRTVKVMALSFSLVDTLTRCADGGLDYAAYWRRSLTSAVAARLLAEKIQRSVSDEAFVGGLLSDIGILAAFHCARGEYAEVVKAYELGGASFQELEQRILGTTHAEISSFLLDHWGLPESLWQPVAGHHEPLTAPVEDGSCDPHLVRCLRAAAVISDLFCADMAADQLEICEQHISEAVGIEAEQLDALLEALDNHVKDTASMFSLNIGRTRSYREIQTEAVAHLARLSMTAEIERAQISQRAQVLDDQNRQLAEKAATDGLTGLANRASLDQHLDEVCRRAKRGKKPIGLLMLDIDRFKKLNDTFGHQAGDEVLKSVGQLLAEMGSEKQFVARYGGEEFAVVVEGTSARLLDKLGETIRQQVQHLRLLFKRQRIAVTTSVGAAWMDWKDQELSPQELIARADRCLYDAKNRGRNQVVLTTTGVAATCDSQR